MPDEKAPADHVIDDLQPLTPRPLADLWEYLPQTHRRPLEGFTPEQVQQVRLLERELRERLLSANPSVLERALTWVRQSDEGKNLKFLVAVAAVSIIGPLEVPTVLRNILTCLLPKELLELKPGLWEDESPKIHNDEETGEG